MTDFIFLFIFFTLSKYAINSIVHAMVKPPSFAVPYSSFRTEALIPFFPIPAIGRLGGSQYSIKSFIGNFSGLKRAVSSKVASFLRATDIQRLAY
jgi:hypothetical protein